MGDRKQEDWPMVVQKARNRRGVKFSGMGLGGDFSLRGHGEVTSILGCLCWRVKGLKLGVERSRGKG